MLLPVAERSQRKGIQSKGNYWRAGECLKPVHIHAIGAQDQAVPPSTMHFWSFLSTPRTQLLLAFWLWLRCATTPPSFPFSFFPFLSSFLPLNLPYFLTPSVPPSLLFLLTRELIIGLIFFCLFSRKSLKLFVFSKVISFHLPLGCLQEFILKADDKLLKSGMPEKESNPVALKRKSLMRTSLYSRVGGITPGLKPAKDVGSLRWACKHPSPRPSFLQDVMPGLRLLLG